MIILKFICTLLSGFIFVYMLYYFWLALQAYVTKPYTILHHQPRTHFLVLIPAKNEESVISIPCTDLYNQKYPKALYDTYVVADHCNDKTVEKALQSHAKVISDNELDKLTDRHGIGKSKTIDGGLQVLKSQWKNYDYLIILDSDNNISDNFLQALNDNILAYNHPEALQVRLESKEMNKFNIVNNGLNTSFKRTNRFQQSVENKYGSAAIMGTGFATDFQLINTLGGFRFKTLVEDEYEELYILLHGGEVRYVSEAYIVNENYSSFKQANRGVRRWSIGSFNCMLDLLWLTIAKMIRRPSIKLCHCFARLVTLSKAVQLITLWIMLIGNYFLQQNVNLHLFFYDPVVTWILYILSFAMSINIILLKPI